MARVGMARSLPRSAWLNVFGAPCYDGNTGLRISRSLTGTLELEKLCIGLNGQRAGKERLSDDGPTRGRGIRDCCAQLLAGWAEEDFVDCEPLGSAYHELDDLRDVFGVDLDLVVRVLHSSCAVPGSSHGYLP
jgi:hypothetical protein